MLFLSHPMYPRVVAAKLNPPASDPCQVPRSHVVDRLVQPGNARLFLVRGPAGFGKTTAMAQTRHRLEQGGGVTAWLTLDAADNDTSRFLDYLAAAIADLQPEGEAAGAQQAASVGELAVSLIDRWASIDFPFVLFLDEFEVIQSPGVLALVGQLVERLPRGGRLVIGSRSLPELRLGRLRASGELLEVDASELRFSLDETRAFFDRRRPGALGSGDLSLLHARTEGWVAALWLAWLALERNDRRRDFITSFSGSEAGLATYLAEEVLSQQREPVRHFLLRTAILNEISVPLCQALMPELDNEAILRELAAANVFLIPIEGHPGTWRYHSLFSSFLRAELQRESPSELPLLHEAAAGAFLALGRTVPAIEHLIAGGKTEAAVTLLRGQAMPLLAQGRLRLLTRWFDALPAGSLDGAPLLQVAYAWAVGYTRGPQTAVALLEAASSAASEDAEVRAHAAALQATLLVEMDRWEDAYAAGRRSLGALPSPSPYADAALVNVLATASAVLGLFDESRRLVERARQSQGQNASHFHRMYSEAVEGTVDMLEGRLRQAQARFRLALQTSQAASVHAGHGNAWAGLLYAVSVYESGDLRQAQQLLQVYLPLAREAWLPDHTILGHVLLSRIAFFTGEIDQAFESLSELEYLGHERKLPRFVASARLERAWLLLRQGHAAAAATELQLAGESAVWRDIGARRHLTHDWDDLAIGSARWELLAGDAAKARLRLAHLLSHAQSNGHLRRSLKLRLLHAIAQARGADEAPAQEEMLSLLRQAAGEGAVRLFVDEGPEAAALVLRVAGRAEAQTDPLFADYLQRLQTAFGPLPHPLEAGTAAGRQSAGVLDPLTAKEVQMLQMLAEGYSNRALAEKLFISDSTVRTHLRSINSKLGASNRTQAVSLGRRYGLIP